MPHRCVLRSQVILQPRLGSVRLPAVRAVQQHLLQLRRLLAALLHVVHIAHDAGEGGGAALGEENAVTITIEGRSIRQTNLSGAFEFSQTLQDFPELVLHGVVIQVLGVVHCWLEKQCRKLGLVWMNGCTTNV